MSTQVTITITRDQAIDRIVKIDELSKEKNYFVIDQITFEDGNYYSIKEFVDGYSVDIANLEKWTNKMLEDLMDQPFFRKSMFENYWVK